MLDQIAFSLLFPEIGDIEPFYLPSIPDGLTSKGPYHMFDLYCQDYMCDCHKVSIVIADETQTNILATVAYGWKSKLHYYKWGLDKDTTESLTNGFLDPWCAQTIHGQFFLNFIRHKINQEPRFINQIKKRYRIFKDHVDNPFFIPLALPPRVLPNNVVSLDAHRRKTA
jgi:hypothetical protein